MRPLGQNIKNYSYHGSLLGNFINITGYNFDGVPVSINKLGANKLVVFCPAELFVLDAVSTITNFQLCG